MPTLSEDLLAGFDSEMASTRKLLECLPEGHSDYKPHVKSMALGRLAGHVAELPGWARHALEHDSLNVAADAAQRPAPFFATSRAEALEKFDRLSQDARALIGKATDQQLSQSWSLVSNDQILFSMPRYQVLRTWFLNHLIHHRAQLGVYLRLLDIPIPGMYGPSADTKAQAGPPAGSQAGSPKTR